MLEYTPAADALSLSGCFCVVCIARVVTSDNWVLSFRVIVLGAGKHLLSRLFRRGPAVDNISYLVPAWYMVPGTRYRLFFRVFNTTYLYEYSYVVTCGILMSTSTLPPPIRHPGQGGVIVRNILRPRT